MNRYLIINSIVPNRWVKIVDNVVVGCDGSTVTTKMLGMTPGAVKRVVKHFNLGYVMLLDIIWAGGIQAFKAKRRDQQESS